MENPKLLYNKNFRVVSHARSNERITAQNGGFIFFPGDKFSPIPEVYYNQVTICKNDKEIIIKELQQDFGISKEVLFPSKENNSIKAKEIFLNNSSSNNSLANNNDVNPLSEIEDYLTRLDCELEIWKTNSDLTKDECRREFERYIRKEKADLISYYNQSKSLSPKPDLDCKEADINTKFEIIRKSKCYEKHA